mgnify:CR=1 FL=1
MPIELYGSSDRIGGNIIDMIAQLTYARKTFNVIHYNKDRLRVYNSYNQEYNKTIFMEILFDLIDKHNTLITQGNTEWTDLAAPSHFEVLTKTLLTLEVDIVSYFKSNKLYTDEIRSSFLEKGKAKGYDIPFNPNKTILVHLRMEDVKNRKDYDKPGYDIQHSTERKVEGNTTCLGYDTTQLEQMSPTEFNALYHPESINDGSRIISLLSENTSSNSTISIEGVSILKSKNQKWITLNCKMLWERDFKNPNNWISNAYYTEIEPTN